MDQRTRRASGSDSRSGNHVLMAAHSEFAPEVSPVERHRDAYVWRLLMTGLSFVLFGLGAVVVGVVLLPLVRIIPASRERKRARARTVMRSVAAPAFTLSWSASARIRTACTSPDPRK